MRGSCTPRRLRSASTSPSSWDPVALVTRGKKARSCRSSRWSQAIRWSRPRPLLVLFRFRIQAIARLGSTRTRAAASLSPRRTWASSRMDAVGLEDGVVCGCADAGLSSRGVAETTAIPPHRFPLKTTRAYTRTATPFPAPCPHRPYSPRSSHPRCPRGRPDPPRPSPGPGARCQ